jgi:hypothetical protein
MPTSPLPRPRKARPGPGPQLEGRPWSSGHHRRHAPAFPAGISRWAPVACGAGTPAGRHSHHAIAGAGAWRSLGGRSQRGISALPVFIQVLFRFIFILGSRTARGTTSRTQSGPLSILCGREPERRKRIRRGNAGQAGGIARLGQSGAGSLRGRFHWSSHMALGGQIIVGPAADAGRHRAGTRAGPAGHP